MAPPKKDLKDKFSPLLTLPPEKLQYINNLIFKENKITPVIKILQNDYGLFHEYKVSTLRIYLHDYKKNWQDAWYQFNLEASVHTSQEIPEELKKELPKDVGDVVKLQEWIPYSKVKVLLQEAVVKFDSMQELERVAIMQYDRVIKALDYESKLPRYAKKKGSDGNYTDEDDLKKPLSGLDKNIRVEIESLSSMLKNIVVLQMDLGIRHKVEAAQNHLHVNLDPHQQKLMKDFTQMKQISDITTQALELITKGAPISVEK
jgi:hypothetical protein